MSFFLYFSLTVLSYTDTVKLLIFEEENYVTRRLVHKSFS